MVEETTIINISDSWGVFLHFRQAIKKLSGAMKLAPIRTMRHKVLAPIGSGTISQRQMPQIPVAHKSTMLTSMQICKA